jgi:hypothetical protein
MRRRLYFVLPDLASAHRTANELLLARVEDRHMHFLGLRDTAWGALHEANMLQKSDIRQAFFMGSGLGALGGAALGVFLKMQGIEGHVFDVGTLILCTLGGAAFGAWAATLIGVSTPNRQLKRFEADLNAGKILLMVDVPARRVAAIQALVPNRNPEASNRGVELGMPAFP